MAAQLSPFLPDRPPMFNEKHYPHLELKHLPRLPIAPLKETLEKYLRAVQPILSEEEYARTKKCVEEFARKEGPELYSILSSFREHCYTSWLEGWWDSMYLEYRESLPINMNPFFALEDDPKHRSQTSRAANLIFATLQFYRQIIENNIEADKDKDKELCMTQYGRLFATTRIPHPTRDELISFINSKHIVVIANSHFYSFDVLDPNHSILPPSHIESNLSFILNDAFHSNPSFPIGILTTEDRPIWSDARSAILDLDKELNSKRNSSIIQTIDSALFIVCLDKESSDFTDADKLSHALLHSDGCNRWFDKSIQLIVGGNGSSGINMEHSGIDGHTVLRYAAEITKTSKTKQVNKAAENEVTDASSRYFASVVSKLEWNIPIHSPSGKKILQYLENATAKYKKFTEITSLKVLEFKKFGRNYIISKKLSPDGFVQMAFQLAYYLCFSTFGSTYESAQTRQYYHGRTECIRSQTPESVLMAKLFASKDGSITSRQKYEALKKAIEEHGKIASNCVNGRGIDRLLTGLYWMAKYRQQAFGGHVYKIPSIYVDKGYKEMKTDMMSTSNCGNPAIKLFGFGAVVPNGLGLGYIIKPDAVNIVVSSFTGKSEVFANNLEKAFSMFRTVLDSIQVVPNSNL